MPQAEYLAASLSLPSGEELAAEFVFLPEGEHEVSALVNGKPGKRMVIVGPDALEPLQASLTKRLSAKTRPFGGFDHKDGKASFIPKAFRYEQGRGVILEVEWTKSGKEAVEGRDYSYFSPTFYRDKKTGKPLGLMPHGEVGSLVNEPAFEALERIAAAHQNEPEIMEATWSEIKPELVKAGIFGADLEVKGLDELREAIKASVATAQEAAVSAAVAEATKDKGEPSELEKEIGALKEKLKTSDEALTKANEALSAKRAAEADEAIGEAVKAGRIPAKDEETKAYWRDQLTNEATADKAKKELAKLPGADALKAKRFTEGDDKNELKGLARVTAAFARN